MARFRDPGRPNRLDDDFGDIPYRDIAPRVLDGREQTLVPFLGAGASRSAPVAEEQIPPPVDQALLQELAARLAIDTEDARLFLEIALAVIARLNRQASAGPPAGGAYEAVRLSPSAPSAAELALALAERSSFDYFGRAKRRVFELTGRRNWDNDALTRLLAALARLTAIGSPAPPLLDASSYLADRKARPDFWSDLYELFKDKRQSTPTHALVAGAAARYLQNNDDVTAADYLVITTNYDCLLESALDGQSVPYYVLTVPYGKRYAVDLRFSENVQAYLRMTDVQFGRMVRNATVEGDPPAPKTTNQFSGLTNKVRPLVTVYKIHGSLHPGATSDKDGVVITNEDYVTFLSASGFVPSYIRTRLRGLGLLLLGYSFTDWNVRSLYHSLTDSQVARRTDATKDYAILLGPSPYETGFFDRNGIDIFDTPLDLFCQRMREVMP